MPAVDELANSTAAIEALLPGLEELANPGVRFEGTPTIPNAQCAGNPVTLAGLRPTGSAARQFFDDVTLGPYVAIAIMEVPDGQAD